MSHIFRFSLLAASLAATAPAALVAQQSDMQPMRVADAMTAMDEQEITVRGQIPAELEGLPAGPDIEGFISARTGPEVEVTSPGGARDVVALSQATTIKASGGFLGLAQDRLAMSDLVNGIPVEVQTVEWGGRLIATEMKLKSKDLKTARMIQTGTDQRFARNEAATEALRGRFADIDKYNVAQVTNVYFDTGKHSLSPDARMTLCQAAQTASQSENAQLLVVGYTDSTGSYELNQELSEKRAARVKNFLQQECGWQPYRMLTPTGMAEADPAADNMTEEGKAQNRRVAINVLLPKSAEGL
jgi:outer membrane protein OmpA-like peptidoglycan-associated protein